MICELQLNKADFTKKKKRRRRGEEEKKFMKETARAWQNL